MKKLVFTSILIVSAIFASAQTNFSIKFGPQVCMTDVVSSGSYDIKPQGYGIRYFGGLGLDFHVKKNAAFTLGLNYSMKRLGLNDGSNSSFYNLHYIQLPLGFKLVTDEIAEDINLYFVGGFTVEVKAGENKYENSEMALFTNAFANNSKETNVAFPIQLGFYLGAGAEWLVTPNNQLFAGINYQRGFINVINPFLKDGGTNLIDKLNVQTGIIQLEVGIKFL